MESQVRFINIEYVFNRIFDVYLWVKYIVLFKLLGTTPEQYLADHRGVEYDGLRDRFGLYDDPFSKGVTSSSGSGGLHASGVDTGTTSGGLSSIWKKIAALFGGGDAAAVGVAAGSGAVGSGGLFQLLSMMRDLMTLLALILIAIFVYSSIRWKEVVSEYFEKYSKSHTPKLPAEKAIKNSRWGTIESYMATNNEKEWRLAILEADSILSDLLKTLPIPGIDVGEKLTNADRKTFQTLDDAWEAHKIRNKIAHEGTSFELSEYTAKKTIQQFKNVFTEFDFGLK